MYSNCSKLMFKSLVFVFLLFLSVFTLINPVFAETVVSLSPDNQSVEVGSEIVVNVYVEPDVNISGVQFDLYFDGSLLDVKSVTEGDLFSSTASTLFNKGTINNSVGSIINAHGIILGEEEVESPGIFATIVFEATGPGHSDLNLTNVFVGNSSGNLPIAVNDAVVSISDTPEAVITVDDDGIADYSSIQAAIINATPGDTIEVHSGVYYENVVLDKRVYLKGIGMPLVHANGVGTGITITASDCIIEGFNVTESGTDWNGGDADSGIKIKSYNNTISNNSLYSNHLGIYLFEASDNTVKNNNIFSCERGIYVSYSSNNNLTQNDLYSCSHSGLMAFNAYNNVIEENIAMNNNNGFYIKTSSENSFINNSGISNTVSGFYVDSSSNNIFYNNNASENLENGYYVYTSMNNIFQENTAYETNRGFYLVQFSEKNHFYNNIASKNSRGFHVTSSHNIFKYNDADFNLEGIVLDICSNNTFEENNITHNTYRGFYLNSQTRSCSILDNKIIFNQEGIFIEGADGNFIKENNISNSTYGILFSGNRNVVVKNNVFLNSYGFYINGDSNIVNVNNVSQNNYGIYSTISSDHNLFLKNNLIENNNYNAYDYVEFNIWNMNHFGDYIGLDSNDDGFGDSTYHIAGDGGAKDDFPAMQPWNVGVTAEGASFLLRARESIELYEGYSLSLNQIDVDGTKAWIKLEKDGIFVDDKVINSGDFFEFTIDDGDFEILICLGKLDETFQGQVDSIAIIEYFYQFSEDGGKTLISSTSDLEAVQTSPSISSISVTAVGVNSANIGFDVNQSDAITRVVYSTFSNLSSSVWTANVTTGISRSVPVFGLNEGTTYYYSIYAYNAVNSSKFSNSSIDSFTTSVEPVNELQPTIIDYSPSTASVSSNTGNPITFTIDVDQIVDVTWQIDNIILAINTNVTSASYTNSTSSAGTYSVKAIVENANGSDTRTWTWFVTDSSSEPTKSSSSSSGGGGGSGTTGEAFENILVKDAAASKVVAGELSRYEFSEKKCHIVYVQFKGVANAGQISTLIEILKDTSTLVESQAPGIVYQNMNIWVGNAAFDDDKVEDAAIGFRVSKEWLSENGIDTSSVTLYRYSDGKWNQLSTTNVDEDDEFIYFESETPGFSSFAISGIINETNVVDDTVTAEETDEEYIEIEEVEDDSEKESNTIPGFSLVLAVAMLITIATLLRRRK